MKKFLALLLALVMVFALAACGGDPATDPSDEPGAILKKVFMIII